jgi:phage gpG-like protein
MLSTWVYKDYTDHFEREMGPNGKWKKHSKGYTAFLKRIGRDGNKILQFSGNLKQAFVIENFRKKSDSIEFFNTSPYGARHNYGLDGMPQRKFMWLSKWALDGMIKGTTDWVMEDN